MSIKSFQYTFTAAETKTYRGGDFFAIEELTDEVDVELFDNTGNSLGKVENVGAGFWIKLPKDNNGDALISRIDVTSASAQTVNVIAGFGEFGTNKTSTAITGGILDPETLVTSSRATITNGNTIVVTPAANTNGVRIDGFTVQHLQTGYTILMSKTSAPSSALDLSARQLAVAQWSTGYSNHNSVKLPIIVPAGEGIYLRASVANQSTTGLEYEVL